MVILIFILLLWFFAYKVYSKKNYLILLPVFYIFVILWVALGFSNESLNNSIWFVEDEQIAKTYFIFITAAISFYIGVSTFERKKDKNDFQLDRIRKILFSLSSNYIVIFYILAIVLFHFAYPIEFIYFRESYGQLYNGNNSLKLLFDLMVNVLALILPFHKSKTFRILLLILLLIFLQGLNKRLIVLIPLLYFLGVYIRDLRFSYSKSFALILTALFFAATTYSYRNNSQQGIIYNIMYFYNNGLNIDLSIEGINYLFGYSFLATLATASFFDIPAIEFWISVNPLPSTIIDVSSVVTEHKLTVYAPYSALGTLGSLGFIYVSIYYFLAGLLFNCCKSYFPKRFSIASVVILLFFVLFLVLSVQYQLRATTRFVYYAIVYFTVLKTVSIYFSNLKQRNQF